jgi:uncharacterized MAPEG superfamily protein
MTYAVAYWCLLVLAVLPYLWIATAKARAGTRYDNRDPRLWLARQQSPLTQRAHAAHLNGFEAFALIAAGLLMAQLAGVPAPTAATLMLVITLARIAHGISYIAGKAQVRSAVWFIGFGCTLALFALAALRVG